MEVQEETLNSMNFDCNHATETVPLVGPNDILKNPRPAT